MTTPTPAASAERAADAEIKALYVRQHGTDAGWLGREGSYFISGVQAGRASLAAAPAAEPLAWAHPDGRVIPHSTKESAGRDGGAMRSSVAGYTVPLYAAPAAPVGAGVPAGWREIATRPLFAFDTEHMARSLFEHIKHGDEAHREWLRVQAMAWARGYFGA
jgi:hypothetical protein